MKFKNLFKKLSILCLILAALAVGVSAQKAPRQDKLLNGLKVFVWNTPAANTVSVKLRIHSGSAFDPQDKEGVIRLLADTIFPNEAAKEFFKDELEGSLEIISNYDYIQINATSRTDEFLTMLETIAAAVTNPTIDKDTTSAVKTALLAKLAPLQNDPAYVADRAIAKRLFGTFPYGRPQLGTPESLQKIDFADLRFARDRLLLADNATLAISGNVDADLALRAAKRYLGAWLKSDKKIPSTFRQPDAPDSSLQILTAVDEKGSSETRHAVRGFSRGDKDFYAAEVLARIMEMRLKKLVEPFPAVGAFVRNQANMLPGAMVIGLTNPSSAAKTAVYPGKPSLDAGNLISQMLASPPTQSEFQTARSSVLAAVNSESPIDQYLNANTYKLQTAETERGNAEAVTLADVQRVAAKLREMPSANVWLFKSVETN